MDPSALQRRCRVPLGLVLVAALVLAVGGASAATPDQWASRSIYQVMTDRFAVGTSSPTTPCSNLNEFCGGNFQGIIANLDYIQGMGFDAIWISPVVLNCQGGYHGYWACDLYQIDPNFGTEEDLTQLVQEAHQRDMYVMLDVVMNHMGCPECWGCTTCNGNLSALVPFSSEADYHPLCEIDNWYNQSQVEVCRLANLPDLNQDDPAVNATLLNWIVGMVEKYQFDGLRLDTVPEVDISFWGPFQRIVGVYTVSEVYNGNVQYVASFQSELDGLLSYPLFFTLRNVYQQQQSAYQLQSTLQAYAGAFRNLSLLGTFLDNHDQPRFLSGTSDYTLNENALVYTLMAQGIPIVYYGSEQGFTGGADPANRESLWPYYNTAAPLYQYIAKVNQLRRGAGVWAFEQVQRYADDTFYAFSRGAALVATSNQGQTASLQRTLTYQPYANGDVVCNLFWPTQDCITVNASQLTVNLDNGEAKIYYPQVELYAILGISQDAESAV